VKVGGKLAEWVRAIGVDDVNVQPNHGWRHRFKTVGRKVGVETPKLDAIQGHAPASEGDGYGDYPPDVLKPEIDKIPRYEVVASAAIDRRRKKGIPKSGTSSTGPIDVPRHNDVVD
jgi:hypothetical protein